MTQYVQEDAQTLTQKLTIHGKYHGKTGYLLENVDAGIQEFMGMGYHEDDVQMMRTDELQMMMSRRSRTKRLHKSIAQTNCTKQSCKTR